MKINITSVHFDAAEKLLAFVETKVGKLEHFFDDILGAEVFLRVEKPQAVENKVAEVKLVIPGNDLFAKKQASTFEEATDLAVEALRQQIIKHKEKIRG
jgi:putative sigma-54 modulation protein